MLKLKRNLLSVALASATVLMATAAQAQTAAETTDKSGTSDDAKAKRAAEKKAQAESAKTTSDLAAVTVTGIRRSIETSIDTKREATSIVESISAEDIGKLPDSSIAESIARLPGLTAQRVAGRSSTISIRGLSADFSNTLLNGREQVSSGNNRGVEFDQYPSELIGGVTIYKTPDASLVGQGLSGTVDLKTVRPLSYKERVLSFNLRGEKNSLGELNPGYDDTGYRFSASYIDQFADGTIGLALGYAHLDSPGQVNKWNSWGYASGTVNGRTAYGLGGTESFATSSDNVRDGLMAVVEFKPNDFYTGVLDVYYSKFDRDDTIRGLQTGLFFSGATPSNIVFSGNTMSSGTFTGVKPVIRNDLNTRSDDIFAIGLNNEFRFSEDWTMVADLSLSRANRDERILETYAGTVGTSDTVRVTIDPNTGVPSLGFGFNYADPSIIRLNDSGGWGQDGYVKYPKFKDELRSIRLSAERSFSGDVLSSLEFGLNYADRDKSRQVAEAFLDLTNEPTTVPSGLLNGPADLGFTGIPGVISYNINSAFNQFYRLRGNVNGDILNKDWEVSEKILTLYGQLNIDTVLGETPVKGNIGLQYVRTDQSSDGFSLANGDATKAIPFSGGAKYNDLLPSLNLAFSYPHDQVLRIAMARQLARPRMDDLRANNNFGIDNVKQQWSGGGGNPELRPWKANAYDVSYEKYFGTKAYISVAGFHKDLKTYIISQPIPYDFTGFAVPAGSPMPLSNFGPFTAPSNGEGGRIRGYEVSLSLPLNMLWKPLDGFGLLASFSHTMTSINPTNNPLTATPGIKSPLPGFSRNVSNVTAYYEKNGFSTRVSLRERSPFLGEIQGFGADLERVYIDQESILDFQMGYQFGDDTAVKGLSLLLQINNVNNTPYRQFYRDQTGVAPDLPQSYQEYGRTVLLGASYKF
jgi:iron complex outermembrane recepter protein